ncbi:MAG: DUF6268 family outer membrane beta-barrel protein [Verrucomicrobiota bacterium]
MSIYLKLLAITSSLTLLGVAQPVIPGWEETRIDYNRIQNLGFELSPGNLAISNVDLHTILTSGATAIPALELYPAIDFRSTILTFNDVPTTLPVDTSQLETFSVYPTVVELSGLAQLSPANSPWIVGLWTRAQLATDFRDIDHDDFSFDAAGGFGYRFTDRFMMGVGAAAMDFNSHFPTYLPGVALDWTITEQIRLQGCGLEWRATYAPNSVWEFSIRSAAPGEIWNIADDDRISRFIDLTTYQIGVFTSLLLVEEIRVEVGIGTTFGNKISLRERDGRTLLEQELDDGWFGQMGLTVRCW